jgi:hypothetical protein
VLAELHLKMYHQSADLDLFPTKGDIEIRTLVEPSDPIVEYVQTFRQFR